MTRRRTHAEFIDLLGKAHNNTITLVPGSEYTTTHAHVECECGVCGTQWSGTPSALLRGAGCPGCHNQRQVKRLNDKAAEIIGVTLASGHTPLEHVGYKNRPSNRKVKGDAVYRYRCGNCGAEDHTATRPNLTRKQCRYCPDCKSTALTTESFPRFLRDKAWANSPCVFYVASVWFDEYIKPGIARDWGARATRMGQYPVHQDYCGNYFCSHLIPRSWAYTIEQIILKETHRYRVAKKSLPIEMQEGNWSGWTELRSFDCDPEWIEKRFFELLYEIQDLQGNWYQLVTKYLK